MGGVEVGGVGGVDVGSMVVGIVAGRTVVGTEAGGCPVVKTEEEEGGEVNPTPGAPVTPTLEAGFGVLAPGDAPGDAPRAATW